MVLLFEWTAMDRMSSCAVPLSGEDTGLEALASPLAGYLGKIQERAASLDCCPWCTSKGLTYALRSYRINLQESITLCTNPQCLFPLVSRSLEDVLASLVPVEPSVGNKRKNVLVLEEESTEPLPKRLRSNQQDSHQTQSLTETLISQAENDDPDFLSNVQHAATKPEGLQSNGYHRCSPVAEEDSLECPQEKAESPSCTNSLVSTCLSSAGHLQNSPDTLLITKGNESEAEEKDDFRQVEIPPKTLNRRHSNQSVVTDEDVYSTKIETPSLQNNEQKARMRQKSPHAENLMCKDTEDVKSETETKMTKSDEHVTVPGQLFWRNSNNLCWLDSLLVALVNCQNLRKLKAQDEFKESHVFKLLQRYKEICAAIEVHHQTGRDGVVRLPNHVLQKADEDLQILRMSIFELLQPKLHCKLGHSETPVFAMPLLLNMDLWAEPLFQSTFHWEFKCSECKVVMTERVMKTLPSFMNILSDWRPLHAVHSAPCNVCSKKNQRRTMILESLSPVFALHFVEGLPDNDIGVYTFTFKGKHYQVTTIIQYKQQLKHFVTWVRNPDGSWVEYDDLKHPNCITHQELIIPGSEMHIVFWEAEDDKDPRACSPSSTLANSPTSNNEMSSSLWGSDLKAGELQAHSPDQSILTSHNDTDIVCALSAFEDTTAGLDTSIGSTTLLDTFEGLSHNDIVTLTLVEVKPDSETQAECDNQQNHDVGNEILDSTPDSSSTVMCNELPNAGLHTTSSSSESEDHLSSDPTFEPGGRGRQTRAKGVGRNKAVSKQTVKTPASSKTAPRTRLSSQPLSVPAQANPPPVVPTPQASSVSSTHASPLKKSEDSPTTVDQNSRWSFLISKHPSHQVQKSTPNPSPTTFTQVKGSTPPVLSAPKPARKLQLFGNVFSRPQLKTEETDGLPIKAAEMYGAFGAKNTPSLPPSPASPCDKTSPPKPHYLPMNTKVVSAPSLAFCRQKAPPEISSLKKHSSQSPKVLPGLSTTEALRYKLVKKLKAKKKKLAKLNKMLGHQDKAKPDSTDLSSPNNVTSSTFDSSVCGDFLSDLLSPATTVSNLSPDSTDFLEMLSHRQDGVNQLDSRVNSNTTISQISTYETQPHRDDFLDDFLSQVETQRSTAEESEALSILDFFV
ncbi:SUMO-specific isopeptidase USPL1 isoform X2 [Halichoeres trimaculatus]|uniref:SUMO-specific isopeptidase USPL1 isoform X2 n=1 Tax=Halichoeres trimaculatus TaxID=147232 RepID=UPI003D9F02CA